MLFRGADEWGVTFDKKKALTIPRARLHRPRRLLLLSELEQDAALPRETNGCFRANKVVNMDGRRMRESTDEIWEKPPKLIAPVSG